MVQNKTSQRPCVVPPPLHFGINFLVTFEFPKPWHKRSSQALLSLNDREYNANIYIFPWEALLFTLFQSWLENLLLQEKLT